MMGYVIFLVTLGIRIHVSTNDVVLAVQALGANKASGLDGIVAEHLLYSSEIWGQDYKEKHKLDSKQI